MERPYNPYYEEKRKVNYRIRIKGCVLVFFSVIIYLDPEGQNIWACWANVGFYTSELTRDFKHYFNLSKLLDKMEDGNHER